MSENIKKIFEQFSYEGVQDDWHVILEKAREELQELEARDRKLIALENAGVDNWEGYDQAWKA